MNGTNNKKTIIIIIIVAVLVVGIIAAGIATVSVFFKHTFTAFDKLGEAFGEIYDSANDIIDDASADIREPSDDTSIFPSDTSEKPEDSVKVEIGEILIEKGEYGFIKSELEVKVTNVSDKMKTFYVEIEAVNPDDGSRIGIDNVFATDLNPGQSQTFKVFRFITSEDADAYKEAEFKVLKVSAYNS